MADPPPVTGPSVAPAQVIREALGVLAFVENGEWVKRGDAALAALAVLEAEREVRGPVQPPLLQTFKELSWWATALANGERDDLSAFASHFASEVTVYARSSSSAVSSVANNTGQEQVGSDRSAVACPECGWTIDPAKTVKYQGYYCLNETCERVHLDPDELVQVGTTLREKAERPLVYPLNRDECLALLDRLAAAEASLVAHREALRGCLSTLDAAMADTGTKLSPGMRQAVVDVRWRAREAVDG